MNWTIVNLTKTHNGKTTRRNIVLDHIYNTKCFKVVEKILGNDISITLKQFHHNILYFRDLVGFEEQQQGEYD